MKKQKLVQSARSTCDVPGCPEFFDLATRGLLRIPFEWRRAKSLGWTSLRLPKDPPVSFQEQAPTLLVSASGWLAFCPGHREVGEDLTALLWAEGSGPGTATRSTSI